MCLRKVDQRLCPINKFYPKQIIAASNLNGGRENIYSKPIKYMLVA